jgi:Protein of unknown function (DUF2905)
VTVGQGRFREGVRAKEKAVESSLYVSHFDSAWADLDCGGFVLAVDLRLGHLPGDIVVERGNFTVYIPIVTGLLLSAALTLFFWIFGR